MPQHLEVEPINYVKLLAEQQRAVAAIDQRGVVRFVAAVDLPPGLEGSRVDDSQVIELLDPGEAVRDVRLVHRGLVLEDLLLHPEKCRLVETQIGHGALGEASYGSSEHRDRRLARGVREESEFVEAGVEGRADQARHAGPFEVRMREEQLPVVVVDSLDRAPVRGEPEVGTPGIPLDPCGLERAIEQGFLEYVGIHGHLSRPQRVIWAPWLTLVCASQATSVAWSFSNSTGVRQPTA